MPFDLSNLKPTSGSVSWPLRKDVHKRSSGEDSVAKGGGKHAGYLEESRSIASGNVESCTSRASTNFPLERIRITTDSLIVVCSTRTEDTTPEEIRR